jgi:hypothetical protein
MTPWQTLIFPTFWGAAIVAGYYLGKHKGRIATGIVLTVLLGFLGLLILAVMPRTDAAKIAAAERDMVIQQKAARRAGYPYPPPGQWTQPPGSPWQGPPPGPSSQPPGDQWQGPQ